MNAAFFDLDGTLADTRVDLAATVNHTRRELGLAELPVETGYIPDGAAVTVYLGLKKELPDKAALNVSVNGAATISSWSSSAMG